jgi:hypothetical protein
MMFRTIVQQRYRITAANQNFGIWKGKRFWIGVADTRDGVIEAVYTYEEAADYDFHHSMYMKENIAEKINNGTAIYFYFDKQGKLEFADPMSARMKQKIWEQIDVV